MTSSQFTIFHNALKSLNLWDHKIKFFIAFTHHEAKWGHTSGSWSTSAQVMACCLTSPSHYLNQCWLIIRSCDIHLRANSQKMQKFPFLMWIWGRVMHICIRNLTIIGSDNGLSPGRPQAIIWTNTDISSIGPLWTNFSEILIAIHTFLFKKMHLTMSSANIAAILSRPQCVNLRRLQLHLPGVNELRGHPTWTEVTLGHNLSNN